MPVLFSKTTTCQQIMDRVAQDVRQTLDSTTAPSSTVLLDYCNRISLEMLRTSRWLFLLSAPQQFMTQESVTNYWLGATGANPAGSYDTGLNLTDLRLIKPKSVLDRSNFRALGSVDEQPLSARLNFTDATSRPGRPAVYRQDEATPAIMNIYPAPDNQNIYTPQPESPLVTTLVSGTLAARLYFVSVTFVDSFGHESTAPAPAKIFVPANSVLKVAGPVEPLIAGTTGVKYDRYNVYAASAPSGTTLNAGQLTLQPTGTNLATSVTFIEPNTGLTTTGAFPPSTNGVEPLDGYIIEFRYFQVRAQLTVATQVLQIPDDYIEIFTAGVNAFAFMYLTRPQEAMTWYKLYREGLTQIVRDINFMVKGSGFIAPDSATIGGFLPTIETLDLSFLTP